MYIYFERSGGFTGICLKTAVNTADLPPAEAQEWEQCLAEAEFFTAPARPQSEPGIDSFIYKLTVVTMEREHTASWREEDTPDELRPMLHQLTTMARRRL